MNVKPINRADMCTPAEGINAGFAGLCSDMDRYASDMRDHRKSRGLWVMPLSIRDQETGESRPSRSFVFYRDSAQDVGFVCSVCPFCEGRLNNRGATGEVQEPEDKLAKLRAEEG